MSVLDRTSLEASPLADLHTIAAELSMDGYRRLRKADLVDLILSRQSGEPASGSDDAEDEETDSASSRRRRGRRGGRGRSAKADDGTEEETEADEAPARSPRGGRGARAEKSDKPARSERSSTRSRDGRDKDTKESKESNESEEPVLVEGTVDLLANGSGFVRVSGPEQSDDDVYISAAQVKRCELVAGDRVSGPRRAPQRSERFASLVRIDTINGRPADELADRARYEDLAAVFPTERFKFASDNETLKAIEFLTPIGRGSRVVVVGAGGAGKSHTLRELATTLAADSSLTVLVALSGVRPEELGEWTIADTAPAATLSFAASADAQDHAVELVIDQAKRVATRGGDAVVLIDSLDGLHPHSARKVLAAARNLTAQGSLTVIATARAPFGGETTVIALDAALASTGRYPAVDLAASATLRPALLVGDAGAQAIADARLEALGA